MPGLHRGILAIFFFFILYQAVYCQTLIYPEKNSFQGRFFNYPVTDPGADVTTYCLYFDRKGFLWQGTYTGLHRFDGIEYKSFYCNAGNYKGLSGTTVTDIYEDGSGVIWIATFGALNRLDQKSWTLRHFSPDTTDLLRSCNKIFLIHEDRIGLIWLLTGENVYTFDKKTETFKKYLIDSLSYITGLFPLNKTGKILEDSTGEIWITSNYGLYRYDRAGDSLRMFRNIPGDNSSLSCNSVTNITEDKKGEMWCTTLGGGLNRITDPGKGTFMKINLGVSKKVTDRFDSLYFILPDSKGKLWLFGAGTVSCYDPETDNTENFILPPPIYYRPDPYAKEMHFQYAFEDKKGEICFLFDINGFFFRMNPLTRKTIFYQVPNYMILSCIMDNTGSFWFGCVRNNTWRLIVDGLPFQTAGINNSIFIDYMQFERMVEYNNKIWLSLKPALYIAKSIDMNTVFEIEPFLLFDRGIRETCFFKDPSGSLWIGRDDNKISCLNKDTSDMVDFKLPNPDKEFVSRFKRDQSNTLWIFTPTKAFILPEGEKNVSLFTFPGNELNKIMRTVIFDVVLDRSDRIWFASGFNDGIYTYDIRNKTVKYYGSDLGLDIPYGDMCMSIDEDSRGRIWALFYIYGLFMLDPDTDMFRKTDIREDPVGKCNYLGICIDNNDQIKISHTSGFTFYDPETEKSRNIRFRQYLGDGCFFRPENGNLIYFIGNQLLIFPDSIPENKSIPSVYITSILINDIEHCDLFPSAEETSLLNKITLSHNQNNLKISFAALDYIDPEFNSYRYYMDGIDRDTIYTTADFRMAEYKKLRHGKYSFWFTGSNNDGKWNPDGKTLEITIMAPWYGSTPAYFVFGLALVSLMVLIIRLRLSQLRKEKLSLEKIVSQRTAELEERNKQILELDNLKTRFFTEISHEIRTPLSLIVGPIENLIRENNNIEEERRMKWLEMVRRNGRRLMKLVNQLLDLSRLDAGKMKIILMEADILNCLRILIYEFLSLGERRNIRFTVDIPNGSFITYFDRDKIEKIISNLLSNAFKFTPAWGTVSCTVRIVEKEKKNYPNILVITVKDTGAGISDENLEKIFDRFYRVEGQWEKDGSGAGIGLSLSNEFVRLLKGTLKVTSEPGSGSLFEVSVPIGKDHLKKDEYIIIESARDEETGHPNSENLCTDIEEKDPSHYDNKLHLLIIEDNTDLRNFITENLLHDYHIYEADNGKAGLSVTLAKIPDLIVTDVIMPDMDGVELCRRIKNDERTSHIPVIILTAKTTTDDRIEGLKSGADDYISKPFDIQELKVRIANLIALRDKLRIRFGSLTGLEHPAGKDETIDDRFMRKIVSVILGNLKDFDFDVGVLQEKIGMSRVHLFRKIKAITGLSPSTLIRNYRMKEAARIISGKPVALSVLAMSVGFSNPSHFSKCFRDYFGVSPKEYAEQKKKR